MKYLCDICNTSFEEPLVIERPERLGEWFSTDRQELCPICAQPHFSEVDECACGGVRRLHEIMCRDCRRALLKRVADFFDTMTSEEEAQFDDWMDGDSITERNRWT